MIRFACPKCRRSLKARTPGHAGLEEKFGICSPRSQRIVGASLMPSFCKFSPIAGFGLRVC
jgi:hypothetical protein